jgi:hypothetical protein
MPFGLQGSSSVLMRVMNSAKTQGLHNPKPEDGNTPLVGPGSHGPTHRSVVVHMDANYPLPLPSKRSGTIGVDWLISLPLTAQGFDQVHVDYLSHKVHAVPTRSTDTAADAAQIILNMALQSGDNVPEVLVVDHDPKFTRKLFQSSCGLSAQAGIPQKYQRQDETGKLCSGRYSLRLC